MSTNELKINMLNEYENILLKKRNWISKIPENKKAVILISGGLDSISTSARLLEDYQIELFPLYVERKAKNEEAEKQSINFFTKYFQEKYGKNKFHNLFKIKTTVPPLEIKDDLQYYANTLKLFYPLRDSIINYIAIQYLISLKYGKSIDINTVFNATILSDAKLNPNATLEINRINTINACEATKDWGLQITSPNIDKNISNTFFNKKEEIEWCFKHNIPIENSMTCWNPIKKENIFYHCGKCETCKRRMQAFIDANIKDTTKYYDNY